MQQREVSMVRLVTRSEGYLLTSQVAATSCRESLAVPPASHTGGPSLLELWRRHKTAEFALNQCGELDRGVVFEPWADDLYSDWQARCRELDRCRRRGQAGNCRNAGPNHLIFIWIVLTIDPDDPFVALRGVVMGKCQRRHTRAEYDIPFPEQLVPLLSQPDAGGVG